MLAHGEPTATARLVKALRHPSIELVVHVDAKSDVDAFYSAMDGRVVFSQRRYDISRKCWSMVEATAELMRSARSLGRDFRTYSLLSGQDYPLTTADRIVDVLDVLDEELLHFFSFDHEPAWAALNGRRHYRDHAYLAAKKSPALPDRMRVLRNWTIRGVHRMGLRLGRGFTPPDGMALHGGSQWWTLSDDAVQYVLEQLGRRPIQRYFRYVSSPDEIVFQTLLCNSPFLKRVRGRLAEQRWRRGKSDDPPSDVEFNLRYVNWDEHRFEVQALGGRPRGPAVLDDRDFDTLKHSGALFARKFHPERSRGLMDRIDRELRMVSPGGP